MFAASTSLSQTPADELDAVHNDGPQTDDDNLKLELEGSELRCMMETWQPLSQSKGKRKATDDHSLKSFKSGTGVVWQSIERQDEVKRRRRQTMSSSAAFSPRIQAARKTGTAALTTTDDAAAIYQHDNGHDQEIKRLARKVLSTFDKEPKPVQKALKAVAGAFVHHALALARNVTTSLVKETTSAKQFIRASSRRRTQLPKKKHIQRRLLPRRSIHARRRLPGKIISITLTV